MVFITIPTILVCIALFLLLVWWLRRPRGLPPGPFCWPLIGNLPNIAILTYRTGLPLPQLLTSLAKDYGSMFSLNLAGQTVIVLNNFKYVKEGLQNPSLSDRPAVQALGNGEERGHGLGRASGEAWKEQRRFTLTSLRSLGVGKKSFEENISEEVEALTTEIRSFKGKSFDPRHLLNNSTSNVICSVVFGKRYEYSDPSFKLLMSTLNDIFKLTGLRTFIPISKYLSSAINKLGKCRIVLREFLFDSITEHKKVHVENDPRDYIDVYLDEIANRQALDRDSSINDKNLPATVTNLFLAGTETTSTTLRWAVLYMMAFPDIQDRIHQELDSVVGRNRLPKLAEKAELPFTWATMLEIQRIASIAPIGVPHSCGEDTTLGPYSIPKGTIIVSNLWAVHHDPDVWLNPDEFNPERFLDENGILQEKDELIPFAIGRRVCIGEHLAKMELYIFFTHLLHQFTIKKPENSPPLTQIGEVGLSHMPKPFSAEFVARD